MERTYINGEEGTASDNYLPSILIPIYDIKNDCGVNMGKRKGAC